MSGFLSFSRLSTTESANLIKIFDYLYEDKDLIQYQSTDNNVLTPLFAITQKGGTTVFHWYELCYEYILPELCKLKKVTLPELWLIHNVPQADDLLEFIFELYLEIKHS